MPSSTVKQAKTMSAIAHGWKPKGKAAGIPVKVAKEFHMADKGHKYGASKKPGMGGPDPVERSVAGFDVVLPHQNAGVHYDDGFMKYAPPAAKHPDRAPRKEGPAPGVLPASARHGYGHDATQHRGHLRTSGNPRADRIGKR